MDVVFWCSVTVHCSDHHTAAWRKQYRLYAGVKVGCYHTRVQAQTSSHSNPTAGNKYISQMCNVTIMTQACCLTL